MSQPLHSDCFSLNIVIHRYQRLYVVLFTVVVNKYIESVFQKVKSHIASSTMSGYIGSMLTVGKNEKSDAPCTVDDESIGRLQQDSNSMYKCINKFFEQAKIRAGNADTAGSASNDSTVTDASVYVEFLNFFNSLLHSNKEELLLATRRGLVNHCINSGTSIEKKNAAVQLREFTSTVLDLRMDMKGGNNLSKADCDGILSEVFDVYISSDRAASSENTEVESAEEAHRNSNSNGNNGSNHLDVLFISGGFRTSLALFYSFSVSLKSPTAGAASASRNTCSLSPIRNDGTKIMGVKPQVYTAIQVYEVELMAETHVQETNRREVRTIDVHVVCYDHLFQSL